jgi:hypothetical protein
VQDHRRRNIGGGRHGIISKAAGEEIAVVAIDEALEQGRTDGHRKSAAHLPVEQGGVQDAAGIVERHVFVDPHLSGAAVDFDTAKIEDKALSRRAVDLVHLIGRCQAWRSPKHRFAQAVARLPLQVKLTRKARRAHEAAFKVQERGISARSRRAARATAKGSNLPVPGRGREV